MKWYGLWHRKYGRLGFNVSPNAEEFECSAVSYTLDFGTDNTWLVKSWYIAERARTTNTPWFNADHDSPSNPFAKNQGDIFIYSVDIPDGELPVEVHKEDIEEI